MNKPYNEQTEKKANFFAYQFVVGFASVLDGFFFCLSYRKQPVAVKRKRNGNAIVSGPIWLGYLSQQFYHVCYYYLS